MVIICLSKIFTKLACGLLLLSGCIAVETISPICIADWLICVRIECCAKLPLQQSKVFARGLHLGRPLGNLL